MVCDHNIINIEIKIKYKPTILISYKKKGIINYFLNNFYTQENIKTLPTEQLGNNNNESIAYKIL